MLRASVISSFLIAAPAAAIAQASYQPPPVGTMVTWSFGSDSERETRISEVVASGDDFVIYLSDLRLDETLPTSYIVEFSGIHVVSCADEPPEDAERARLKSAWPLKGGDVIEVTNGTEATYTVGERIRYIVKVGDAESYARRITAQYGSIENDITLSMRWNIPVAVEWPDGTGDMALEVLPPSDNAAPKGDLRRALGKCAALLK